MPDADVAAQVKARTIQVEVLVKGILELKEDQKVQAKTLEGHTTVLAQFSAQFSGLGHLVKSVQQEIAAAMQKKVEDNDRLLAELRRDVGSCESLDSDEYVGSAPDRKKARSVGGASSMSRTSDFLGGEPVQSNLGWVQGWV
eukprot:522318-Pyramimonas_sp.AAC.1